MFGYFLYSNSGMGKSIIQSNCLPAKLWIAECIHDRATSLVIGSQLLKLIYAEADHTRLDQWPTQ